MDLSRGTGSIIPLHSQQLAVLSCCTRAAVGGPRLCQTLQDWSGLSQATGPVACASLTTRLLTTSTGAVHGTAHKQRIDRLGHVHQQAAAAAAARQAVAAAKGHCHVCSGKHCWCCGVPVCVPPLNCGSGGLPSNTHTARQTAGLLGASCETGCCSRLWLQ